MTAGKLLAMVVGALMWVAAFGAAFGGAVALVAGLTSTSDGPPTCDGAAMHPGDQCLVVVGDERSQAGYEEMVRRKESSREDGLVIGGTCLGAAAVLTLGGWGLLRWSAR
ncbi:hypothetical protein [Saccharopolyspora hordei]|uniref:Uncharacterized protein n=1 Tax=Saccharopolyspora hordei TaxID=1838 RepID=A0A853AD58_9PSEU|nr:hypothetical protein [Saccharopolyspora hordei]NYI81838.1 hypothetical protein [Saccharopolyspora hordei]